MVVWPRRTAMAGIPATLFAGDLLGEVRTDVQARYGRRKRSREQSVVFRRKPVYEREQHADNTNAQQDQQLRHRIRLAHRLDVNESF